MTKKKKRMLTLVCLLLAAVWILWGNTALEVNEYRIGSDRIPDSFSGFRIAHISDLHNAEFGEGNGKLLAMIAESAPDIIVITGDLVDSRNTDIDIALEFIRGAVEIAPVYYVTGNHEARISDYGILRDGLSQAGATVLRDEKLGLERAGETITLMGMNDPSFQYRSPLEILDGMTEADDGYTVLLCHRPELFDTYAAQGIDLVFTGHAHGGQFRLPFVGGLIAPHQGLFPTYDAGLYTKGHTNMLVSRGIGNSLCPIRFNNRSEIIVVELKHTN